MAQKHAVIILAHGFEETEAVSIIDVLRRADVKVTIAGAAGEKTVSGNHDISLVTDKALADIDPADVHLAALPGGMPGAANLAQDETVHAFLRTVHAQGGYVAAICAAPIALHAAGLLAGRAVTCYPSFADGLAGAKHTGALVEIDDRVITSQGPGTALLFGLKLAELLTDVATARHLADDMLVVTAAAGNGES